VDPATEMEVEDGLRILDAEDTPTEDHEDGGAAKTAPLLPQEQHTGGGDRKEDPATGTGTEKSCAKPATANPSGKKIIAKKVGKSSKKPAAKKSKKKSKLRSPSSSTTSSSDGSTSTDSSSDSSTGDSDSDSDSSSTSSDNAKIEYKQRYKDLLKLQIKKFKADNARKAAKIRKKQKKASKSTETQQQQPGGEQAAVPADPVMQHKPICEKNMRKIQAEADYDAVRQSRAVLYTNRNVYGDTAQTPDIGSFRNPGDTRYRRCRESSSVNHGITTSCSFTYKNMMCVSCAKQHPLLGKDQRPVFVLADQTFPATATPVTGQCVAVMRMEDASLAELAENFIGRVRMNWLPAGTLVFIASGGQLARVGVAEYASELVKAIDLLKNSLPPRSVVSHAPVILLNGSVDSAAVRSLFDALNWLCALSDAGDTEVLKGTMQACCNAMAAAGSEATAPHHTYRMVLPTNLSMPMTRAVWASDPRFELPSAVRPATVGEEAEILRTFVSEINEKYRTRLGEELPCDREVPEEESERGEEDSDALLIFIGGLHASKLYAMATERNKPTMLIRLLGFTTKELTDCAQQIRAIVHNMETTRGQYVLVYCMMEHLVYRDNMSRTAIRGAGGVDHIVGDVHLIEDHQISGIANQVKPVLAAGGQGPKIIVSPVPQYINAPCCSNINHCANVDRPEYRSKLHSMLPVIGRQIGGMLASEAGIRRFRVINVTQKVINAPADRDTHDPPELSSSAYRAVLEMVLEETPGIIAKRKPDYGGPDRNVRPRRGSYGGPTPPPPRRGGIHARLGYRSGERGGTGEGRRGFGGSQS